MAAPRRAAAAAPAAAAARARGPVRARAVRVQASAAGRPKVKKVVLAYSGGLDTSVILKWLQDEYKCEVVTFTADLGQVRCGIAAAQCSLRSTTVQRSGGGGGGDGLYKGLLHCVCQRGVHARSCLRACACSCSAPHHCALSGVATSAAPPAWAGNAAQTGGRAV